MSETAYKYDVAISFLTQDEAVAKDLVTRLSPNLRVFVYFEEQRSLAGEHGPNAFRKVFRKESRVVAVLYRSSWGTTPYTRVEQTAIEERFLEEGDRFLLFVRMDNGTGMPTWAPETKIWLDFKAYGIDEVVGALKHRAEQAGAELHVESASERLRRSAEEAKLRKTRSEVLEKEGYTAFNREARTVLLECEKTLRDAAADRDAAGIQFTGEQQTLTIRSLHASVIIEKFWEGRVVESRIVFRSWSGKVGFPGELRALAEPVRERKAKRFSFDYEPVAKSWRWHEDGDRETFSSADLAEHMIKLFLDIDEQERQTRERRDRNR